HAAAKNTSVTEHLSYAQVLDDQRDLLRTLDTVQKLTSRTIEQDTSLRAKFQAVGSSDAVGILLRKQRNDLPNRRLYREAIARQETLLTDVNLKTFEIRDELSSVADPGA